MRAGPIHRARVSIERDTPTRSSAGGFTPAWSSYATNIGADIRGLRGREFEQSDQIRSDVTHKIVIRWDPRWTVTPRDRITWGSRVFHVEQAINVNERSRMIEILAKEEV